MQTRLAGETAMVPGLPSCATIDGSVPEPPGSTSVKPARAGVARGR
jgi:hypothetical protein